MRDFPPFLSTAALSNLSLAVMADWTPLQWVACINAVAGIVAGIASILRGKTSRGSKPKGRRARVVRPSASAETKQQKK